MVEGCGNDRSVMPLDVQGCTRTTLIWGKSIYMCVCALNIINIFQ